MSHPDSRVSRRAGYGRIAIVGVCVATLEAVLLVARPEYGTHAAISPLRRHVLLVTVDTLRNDYLSGNGYELETSPFLDELLEQGHKFTRAVTPIARTTPALASLLSGLYPRNSHVQKLVDTLPADVASIAELAKKRGYSTVAVVSNHILTPERGLGRGFDVYDFAPDSRDAAETTATALAHLDRFDTQDAIFAWVHYIDPHVPYYPPARLATEFDQDYEGPYRLRFGDRKGGVGNLAYPSDLGKARAVFQNDLPDRVNEHVRRLYAADIRFTDDHVRELVQGLAHRFGPDWLVVFTADHGESLGESDYYYDHGDYVSNAEVRVPLVFRFAVGDPLHARREHDAWVSLVDVMPTLADLLGLEFPRDRRLDGRSLVPYFQGHDLPPRPVFAESGHSYFPQLVRHRLNFGVEGRFRAAFSGDLKLIWTPEQQDPLEYALYDVRKDPHETRNLYSTGIEQAELLKRMLSSQAVVRQPSVESVSAADQERLRSLGYME